MKAKYVGLLLASAVLMAIPSGVMAEESTEAVAVEESVAEEENKSLEEQLNGLWSGISESKGDKLWNYGTDIAFINGKCIFGSQGCLGVSDKWGNYVLNEDMLSIELVESPNYILFGEAGSVTGKIAFEEIELTEEMKEILSEERYTYCEEKMPTVLTFTVSVPDNSDPLAPKFIDRTFRLYKNNDDESFVEIVLFDAEWELDNGLKLSFDSNGKTSLIQLDGSVIEGDSSYYFADDKIFRLGISSTKYVIDELSVNEVTMHLQEDPTSITHMTRIQN